MSKVTFSAKAVASIESTRKAYPHDHLIDVELHMTELQLRDALRQIGSNVSGETLTKWIEEDLHMEIAP